MRFYPVKVVKLNHETPDSVAIELEIPTENREDFKFLSGQYLTFRHQIDGEEIRRSYSIACSPKEPNLTIGVKQIGHGIFSTFANSVLKVGDTLEVAPPQGNFINKGQIGERKSFCFIAAGSGITPIISLIQNILATDDTATCCLYFVNRNTRHIMFRELIEDQKNMFPTRFEVHYFLSKEKTDAPLFNGRLDFEKFCNIHQVQPFDLFDECFLCGPEQMLLDFQKFKTEKCPNLKLHYELFTTTTPANKSIDPIAIKKFEGKESEVTIKIDGLTIDLKVPYNGLSILEAALEASADLPFACKGGVCCTCRAKLVEGEVEMRVNYALEPDEVEDGYVLTCQSQPRSPKVVIDFDEGH